ncbi:MAG TPA: SIS domain-containing protein [Caldilineaceae bacterium]|nr:SIS domain-containing protein [Caldilineaceae bacterium]
MTDLNRIDEIIQADSQGWFARAAQVDGRPAAAEQRIAGCLDALAARPLDPANEQLLLALPPELLGIGRVAATLQVAAGLRIMLCPAPLRLMHPPTPALYRLPAPQVQHVSDGCLSLVKVALELDPGALDDVAIGASATVNLAPYLHGADHPALALRVLLGVLAAADGAAAATPPLAQAALAGLHRCRPETPVAENPAKQLALRFYERVPLVWGEGIAAAVAQDWAMRYCWYAEAAALAVEPAEVSRLLVMARLPRFWPNTALFTQLPAPAQTTDTQTTNAAALHAELADATLRLLARRRFATLAVTAPPGLSPLDHLLYLLELGEWVALYAAALYGVDPAQRVPLQLLFEE